MAEAKEAQPPPTADELTARAAHKRYEGLVVVRTKAVKGKGAWYWDHLEPVLVHNPDTGLPKAVKLRCSLCDAHFSASNPSRTASEHLKRGACSNFAAAPRPNPTVSSSSPPPTPSLHHNNRRKRSSSSGNGAGGAANSSCLAIVAAAGGGVNGGRVGSGGLMLSGGKEDLGALAMLEDCVKRLKSPDSSPCVSLSKSQADSALDCLADWFFESCGSVSLASLHHPKFRTFLRQIGLPAPIAWPDFFSSRLDSRYEEVKSEGEAKIRDAMFFQIASAGWQMHNHNYNATNLVSVTVNLPNGTSVYGRAVLSGGGRGPLPPEKAEEILSETMADISGNTVQRCAGIVADKYKAKALRKLEDDNQWMVNLCCQFHGITRLISDFIKELALFRTVTHNCLKLTNFVNGKYQVRACLHRYQLQEYGSTGVLQMHGFRFRPAVCELVEDVLSSARALQLVLLDESFKRVAMEDPSASEVAEMIGDMRFWNEVKAAHSLVIRVKEMARRVEVEKPLIGQCLPIWEDIRTKVRDWCSKFQTEERPVERVIERRFRKNYHPAWAAAFILDPLYLIKDAGGKYLPPFKCLTAEQEKDVDRLITRLVSREEAHVALMELMKWRTQGLDPVYAQAVQMRERDPITGRMRLSNPQSSRLVWETHLTEFKSLGKVAARLIFLRATACGFKCNPSLLRWVDGASKVGVERAQKMVFIAAHSKLETRDFSSEEDRDVELFAGANSEDDVLNEVFVDASPM